MSDYEDVNLKLVNASLIRLIEQGKVVCVSGKFGLLYVAIENMTKKGWENQATPEQIEEELGKPVDQLSDIISKNRNRIIREIVAERQTEGVLPC